MALDNPNTVALLHMDGADTSTTFTDESGKTWTAYNSAQIDTAQSKFGGGSGLFVPASHSYLSTPDHADFNFGAGNFTFDTQIRFVALSATQQTLFAQFTNANYYWMWYITNTAMHFKQNEAGLTIDLSFACSLGTDTWYHLEIDRSGSSWYAFVEGTQIGSTGTDDTALRDGGTAYKISTTDNFGEEVNGWLDEFRVSNVARHTANFTAPTKAYGVPGVKTINRIAVANIKTWCGIDIANIKSIQGLT